MITLYGQPNCQPCRIAENYLRREQVPFTYVDLSERPNLVQRFRAQGLLQTPIIQTPTRITAGFSPDALRAATDEARELGSSTPTTPALESTSPTPQRTTT